MGECTVVGRLHQMQASPPANAQQCHHCSALQKDGYGAEMGRGKREERHTLVTSGNQIRVHSQSVVGRMLACRTYTMHVGVSRPFRISISAPLVLTQLLYDGRREIRVTANFLSTGITINHCSPSRIIGLCGCVYEH